MSPSDPLLKLTGISKSFPGVPAVREMDLQIRQGELHALLGPSGCGKTTLLRLVAGFEEPDSGTIRIGDVEVAGGKKCLPAQKREVGLVFQDYHLFPHMTVDENVAYGVPEKSKRRDRVAEVLDLVGLTGETARYPHELSGGQQQRVALARALAPRPRLLLLDEPFSSLDEQLRVDLRRRLKHVLEQLGMTALLVTHHQEEALSIAHTVSVMFSGRLLQTAAPRLLYLRPVSREVASFVGESNFIPGTARGRLAETELGILAIDRDMTGPVELLLRPESVVPRSLPGAEAMNPNHLVAEVIDTQFFGREQLLTLDYGEGRTLLSRVGIQWPGKVGSKVALQVQGVLSAYAS